MDIDALRNYCLQKTAVSESFPFNESTLVFKVGKRIFCLTNLDTSFNINLKCNPERAIELREEYEDIIPGYHMNKKHWNTVNMEGHLPDRLLKELIDDSYMLVIKQMSKKEKKELNFDN